MAVRTGFAVLAAALVVGVGPVPGSAASRVAAGASVLATTLDNGLRVVLVEDRRSPVVALQVFYRVGSRDEARGATGLAHLLEHMMFKGTRAHGPGRFAALVEGAGGRDNAFTSRDVTGYWVNLPAERLELALELEADRMTNLRLDPAAVEAERQVVIEERRTRVDDDPGGFLGEQLFALAFRAHPYGAPIIGWREDLDRLSAGQLREFYQTYYAPNNAILVAVGDFVAADALALVRRYFGALQRRGPPPLMRAVEPPQHGERRVVVSRPARLPLVYLAWRVPAQDSADAPALEVLSAVLTGGRASRLHRELVTSRRVALDVGSDYPWFSLDPSLFWIWGTAMPGRTPEELEAAILAELERLTVSSATSQAAAPVSAEELARAKNQLEAQFVFHQDSVRSRARLLAQFELVGGHALAETFLERIRAVTAADVARAASAWLVPARRNVGILRPAP